VAGAALGLTGAGVSVAQSPAPPRPPQTVTLRAGKAAWVYSDAQLLAMATDLLPNLKGNRKKPAIGLDRLIARDARIGSDRIDMIVVIGEIVTLLRGADLTNLDKLVLATGRDKGGQRHDWALAARDEKAYMAISPSIGSGRKHGIYRIDVILKGDAG
jgi:hypothetical protein